MSYKIVNTPEAAKEIKRLFKKYASLKDELIQLNNILQKNPFQGTPLGNNLFKIRLSIKSKGTGKRGGARIITFIRIIENEVLILSIYDKADQANITMEEIKKRIKNFLF